MCGICKTLSSTTPNSKKTDSYKHTKDFFLASVKDGEINKQRALLQYRNPSISQAQVNDLLVLKESLTNRYGHVAIISNFTELEVEIIQQNPGAICEFKSDF